MTVERKREEGTENRKVIWKIAIANKSPGGGERTAGFTLLVHPSRSPVADRRQQQWQPWTDKAATPALDAASRGALTGSNLLVRADAGSVCETVAARAILEGAIGGDALTATNTIADRYPLGLFRYLAATHTALAVQLRSNGRALVTPGGSLAVDNMILGRALVHDIGVDIAGLASRANAADVVNALESFGYFKNDGQTEFLPYWRAEDFGIGLVRYGAQFEADAKQGFALTTENPAGRVRTSLFLRPASDREPAAGRKVMMVLVNESDHPVRELLYVENPGYLFGGENRVTFCNVLAEQDTSYIPDDSDWRREESVVTPPMGGDDVKVNIKLRTQKDKSVRAGMVIGCLQDPITGGYVKTSKMGAGFTLFGPLYIPARGMRLLTASAAPEGGVVGSVWKVTKDGKRTPVAGAPVYVFGGGGVPVVEKMEQSKAKPRVTVRSSEDGTFRAPLGPIGKEAGYVTVVAEVDGKLYPDRQILGRGKEGIVATWPAIPVAKTVKIGDVSETFYWPECEIEVLEGNAMPQIPEGPAKPELGKPWTEPHTVIEFVWIPPGEFDMGSPESEAGRAGNETLHPVTLTKGFWMSKYEITQGQWMRVMGSNPSKFKYAGDKAPVENVAYNAPGGFAARLTDLAYGTGLRFLIPTEAQWEYACRAGSKTALYNGPLTLKGAYNGPELNDIAWYGGNSGISNALAFDTRKWHDRQFDSAYSGTHPVGQKKPNAFGLYDMIGNVAEWTSDLYTNDWGTAAVTDPFNPPNDPQNIYLGFRGGAWNSMPAFCRAACRRVDQWPHVEFPPPYDASDLGVRLVCVINQEPVITEVSASATNGTAPLTVEFKATATDADGDQLRYLWKFGDKNKRGGGTASGSVVSNTYEKFGTNIVSLFVTDGKGDGVSNSVIITVTRGANRLPVAWSTNIVCKQGMGTGIRMPVRDDDDDPLQFVVVTPPQHGKMSGNLPTPEYKSEQDFRGPDSFTFKAWDAVKAPDGTVQTNYTKEATVSITVEPR
ncbi:MAG: SUMF1/EgtB/PvdO family nonheme iron enzyme [bacterium]